MKRIIYFLAPPVFADDEEKTRNAYLLNVITISSFLGALSYGLIVPAQRVPYGGLAMGVALTAWLVMRRGYIRLASNVLVGGFSIVLALAIITAGGIHAPEYSAFIIPILFSGLLLGWRATFALVGVSVLFGAALLRADLLSLLPETVQYQPATVWIINSVYFVLSGVFLTLVLQMINHALREARAELAGRQRIESDLRKREAILEATARSAELLLRTPDWRDVINPVLEELGRNTHASHAYLFENHQDAGGKTVTSLRYEWSAPACPSDLDDPAFKNVPVQAPGFENWYARVSNKQPYVGDERVFTPFEADFFYSRGIKAILEMPIVVEDRWWGIIGFDDSTRHREWSSAEVDAMIIASNVLGAAIHRQQAGALLKGELYDRKQAEERLIQFQKVMDESNDAIYVIDLETGRYVDFNRSAYECLGYSREELSQMSVFEVAQHIPNLEVWRQRVQLVKERGGLIFETVYKRKDGRMFPTEVSARMLEYGDGEILLAVVRDITERKYAEEALVASEAKFRMLAENTPIVVYQCKNDARFTFLYLNDAVEQLTGYPKSAFLEEGLSFFDLYHPDDVALIAPPKDQEYLHRPSFHITYRIRHKSGEWRWVDEWGTYVNNEMDDTEYIVGMMNDLTERKQAQAALLESEERFRKVFQYSPVAICITTLKEGRLLDGNHAYWELSGYDPETSIGRDYIELKMWDRPEDRVQFIEKLQQRQSLYNPDYVFNDTKGNQKSAVAFYQLIRIGHADCVLSMFYDMSAQKATMQALQQSEARIRALLEAMPDMIFEFSAEGVFLDFIPAQDVNTFLPPQEFLGKNIRDVFPAEVSSPALFAIQRALETGQLHAFEYLLPMGGELRSYEARIMALSSQKAIAIVREITTRKQMEQEREKFVNELEIKNKESETLRESLASIVGTFEFSEIIQRIMSQIRRVVPYDTASIWRVEGNQQFIIGGVDLPPEIKIPGTVFTLNEYNSAYPILNGEVPYVLNNNVQEELSDFWEPPHNYIHSWLAIPLKTRGRIIGLIALDGRQKNQFNEHHAELAAAFANQVAIALDNAGLVYELQVELEQKKDLIAELEARNAEAETLRESTAIVAATLEISETVQRILEQLKRVVPYDSASVQLLRGDSLEIVGGRGLPEAEESHIGMKFIIDASEPSYPVLQGNLPYILYTDTQTQLPNFNVPPHTQIRSWLAVPLKVKGNVVGVIALDGNHTDQFSERHAQLAVTYASQVAIALENSRLFSELQAELAERRQAEINLRQRESILEIVADAANLLLKTKDWKTEINTILERLGRTINASHAYLFENRQLDNGQWVTSIRYEWTAPGFESDLDDPAYANKPLDDGELDDWFQSLKQGSLYIGDYAHLTPADMDYLLERGIRALLDVPIFINDDWWGVIGFDDMGTQREWTNAEVDALLTAANVLGAAIQRQHADDLLQAELDQRKQLNAELESKNAELERFTYTVSHDLKSPLFTIRGFLGYLEQDALAGDYERMKSDIQRITDATEKMQRLLNELLELSRIGRLKNESQAVPFDELAREVVELVQGRVMERGIRVDIQRDLPVIFGDRQRLFEVVQNLLDNAAKFMGDQKEPHIEIGGRGEEAGSGMPILYVKDNGIGIAPEHHERIFGLFNKLDVKSEGTGIGLALVRRIIEIHGGRIWVESEAGQGAAFYFTLPKAAPLLEKG